VWVLAMVVKDEVAYVAVMADKGTLEQSRDIDTIAMDMQEQVGKEAENIAKEAWNNVKEPEHEGQYTHTKFFYE
jgi:hypothetical protein